MRSTLGTATATAPRRSLTTRICKYHHARGPIMLTGGVAVDVVGHEGPGIAGNLGLAG
jgi:hypothetical protein